MDRIDRFVLLRRIESHSLDEPGAVDPFSARLARENGWSPAYAARVIKEYVRFAFLAATAGHSVTPSDQVDQAWHLHLTYSRSYWSIFCDDVLGKSLHHGPSPGGSTAALKYRHDYERTLESYRAAFEAEPPIDIWPPVEQRFGTDLCHQRVNVASNWVVPKPRWWTLVTSPGAGSGPRWARRIAMALTAVVAGYLCESLDIYQLHGARFLFPYLLAWLAALAIASDWDGIRAGGPSSAAPIPDVYQTAYLAGGPRRALSAALGILLARKDVTLCLGDATVARGLPLAEDSHPVESAIYARIADRPLPLTDALKCAGVALDGIKGELGELGLWRANVPLFPVLLGVVLATVGILKSVVGMANGRPVGLLFLMGLGGLWAIARILRSGRRATRRGEEVIATMKERQASLRSGDASRFERQPGELGLAIALFGPDALAGTPWSALTPPLTTLELTSDRNSEDRDGGGSCGGGGCGGGGCGGCGG